MSYNLDCLGAGRSIFRSRRRKAMGLDARWMAILSPSSTPNLGKDALDFLEDPRVVYRRGDAELLAVRDLADGAAEDLAGPGLR